MEFFCRKTIKCLPLGVCLVRNITQSFLTSLSLKLTTFTAQKMKFSVTDFFSKCDQIRSFTEEIRKGKFNFLCSDCQSIHPQVFSIQKKKPLKNANIKKSFRKNKSLQ